MSCRQLPLSDKSRRNKGTRYEAEAEPEKHLLLSILHYLEKDVTPKEISAIMGIDEKYLGLWLLILLHFRCIEPSHSTAAGYVLMPKGKKLVKSFQHRQ